MAVSRQIGFKRPVFDPKPTKSPSAGSALESISSLPQLIQFNARENPNHIFALQSELVKNSLTGRGENSYNAIAINFKQLDQMVCRCADWIRRVAIPVNQNGELFEERPIAIFLESGVGLFLHLAALLSLNIPVLLVSARLSSTSILHLLRKTGAKIILASQRTKSSLSEDIHSSAQVVEVEPYCTYMAQKPDTNINEVENAPRYEPPQRDANDINALILHSSGTTGLPKPIYLAHRYILGYAACHQFAAEEEIDWINLSTLPLYHGFGLLAPCLSLSIGMTCCFPPSSIIPATNSTLDLIRKFGCRSLMTVPSIIDDIHCLSDKKERNGALELLAGLEFLAVGGGALKTDTGAKLVQHNIKLLNHYGVTEIGAIAPIFRPGSDYNWRFLRLRSDLGLELHPIKNSPHFRLVGYPIGWGKPFEVQDELERNETSSHVEVRILGRSDDVIVLKTGEKVQPRLLEDTLNMDPVIQTAVCVGNGFFELAIIIDIISDDIDARAATDHVWKLIQTINLSVDHHARITSRHAIIIKPAEKQIPRSDKGSVMRQAVHEIFREEICNAYNAMELDTLEDGFSFDTSDMESTIRHLVTAVAQNRLSGENLGADEDLFERGMDSLQAVRLARLLGSGLRQSRYGAQIRTVQISADFIYRNPTVRALEAASLHLIDPQAKLKTDERDDRALQMKLLAAEFIEGWSDQAAIHTEKHTILMTGSTGNLGAHTLARLARIKSIEKIICLIRCHQPGSKSADSTLNRDKAQSNLLDRQERAFEVAGICLKPHEWEKIEILDLESIVEENDVVRPQASNLAHRITHILHLAWPMDFQRRLDSFKPHIRLLQTLVKLGQNAFVARKKEPIRLLFSSSIAVVRHHGDVVPESAMQDPLVSVPMGYAEAKWICETYLNHVSTRLSGVEPIVVRVGQLSGPERTSGVWKTEEHLPALVQASQKIGAFPKLDGVASWMPVDRAALSLVEMLMHQGKVPIFLHLENPVRQPLNDIFTIMAHELRLQKPFMISFDQWLQRASEAGEIRSLESFYRDHFRELAGGAVRLDTIEARRISKCLLGSRAIEKELIIEYVRRWQRDGFLR
ncbi:hypothetical protein F5B22DRAFT_648285 [Xylaria bambusicola]|uniref:uncharacterized protein n=1 Tax=Xylaria bambusicola TaxID=326684 RepID=UPI00200796A0|nr:uncharacterized protein F5B22DRAFT_648285 [Xylaria bambusicola]KAI0512932.1 hypothetical protein F5B22DRAFT_648285 [Xylaria bambusicola]